MIFFNVKVKIGEETSEMGLKCRTSLKGEINQRPNSKTTKKKKYLHTHITTHTNIHTYTYTHTTGRKESFFRRIEKSP